VIKIHSKKKTKEKLKEEKIVIVDHLEYIKETFSYPLNQDIKLREILLPFIDRHVYVIFLNGMIDGKNIEESIITPLVTERHEWEEENIETFLAKKVLRTKTVDVREKREEIVADIVDGRTVIIIEGSDLFLSINTTHYEYRSVDKPQSENVIKGTNEAFTEGGQVNRSLIRKRIRDENLITESIQMKQKKIKVSMLYLKNITNDTLVEEVRKRVEEIEAPYIDEISILEQHLEERPYSLVPTILYTERPDRAVSFLREGYVVLVMENSPGVLIAPVTFWSFFHTSEDYYLKWAYGNFIRMIRLFAVFVALFTPSFYIAIVNFHSAMIPTDLLLAIAATRETVPFPVFIEVLIMELAFEVLREAGIRIPVPMGSTIGIVGALILGQAAVDANIISPILVIIVALTGLSSFAIPNVSFNFMIRIARFGILLLAAFMGFYGVTIGMAICVSYLATVKSFGIPFLSPMTPYFASSKDTLIRNVVWKEWIKPMFVEPKTNNKNPKTKGKLGDAE